MANHDTEQSEPAIDISHFRERLLAMRAEIEELASARAESQATVELDQSRVGRLSRMDAMQQQAMAKATAGRAETTLARIAAALRRCDEGSYGLCLGCDELINPQRLEIDPATTLCVECAEARDPG